MCFVLPSIPVRFRVILSCPAFERKRKGEARVCMYMWAGGVMHGPHKLLCWCAFLLGGGGDGRGGYICTMETHNGRRKGDCGSVLASFVWRTRFKDEVHV